METRIKSRVECGIEDARVNVTRDGSRFEIRVVSPAFEGLSRVKKQQLVYASIQDLISDGSVHAVTIEALTPAEANE
ncbi:MAG: BolA/IbaG family iron-sulfur metabolism protein [Gammaproteobacteria bacterium]|nr:BolA/IbaG family iron-sulfur metabolism protein [Gammaproteobacteria bacterium]